MPPWFLSCNSLVFVAKSERPTEEEVREKMARGAKPTDREAPTLTRSFQWDCRLQLSCSGLTALENSANKKGALRSGAPAHLTLRSWLRSADCAGGAVEGDGTCAARTNRLSRIGAARSGAS